MERSKTIKQLCDEACENAGWVGYFKRAKAIILDDSQDYTSASVQPRFIQIGIAVTEQADLVLKAPWDYQDYDPEEVNEDEADACDRKLRGTVFEALMAFASKYPQDFASHLQFTWPHFAYKGLLDTSKDGVWDFWSHLHETLVGADLSLPEEDQNRVDWLVALSNALSDGLTTKEAFSDAYARVAKHRRYYSSGLTHRDA